MGLLIKNDITYCTLPQAKAHSKTTQRFAASQACRKCGPDVADDNAGIPAILTAFPNIVQPRILFARAPVKIATASIKVKAGMSKQRGFVSD